MWSDCLFRLLVQTAVLLFCAHVQQRHVCALTAVRRLLTLRQPGLILSSLSIFEGAFWFPALKCLVTSLCDGCFNRVRVTMSWNAGSRCCLRFSFAGTARAALDQLALVNRTTHFAYIRRQVVPVLWSRRSFGCSCVLTPP